MKLEINGILMNALVEGQAGAPVVTLSHSLAASLEMWRPQMPALTRLFRIVRYDTRGHGGTNAPPGPYTLRDLAEDAGALLARLGITRTHFVGLSMGGMIGQQLAIDHPNVIDSLVLADTVSAYPPEARPMWESRIAAASGPDGMEPLVEPTVKRWFTNRFRDAEPDTIEWVRRMIRTTRPQGFIGCCHALMRLDLTERLRTVEIPTHVIVGRQDPTTPVSGAEAIRDAVPNAEMTVIEDAAHISNVEQPNAFTAILLDFLTRQASGATLGRENNDGK